jgi:hypothetical protein
MCLKVAAAGAAAIAMPPDTTVAAPVQVCVYMWQQQGRQLLPSLLIQQWQLYSSLGMRLQVSAAAGVAAVAVFSTQLCELLPLSPSPWLAPPPPSLCE